MTTIAPTLQAFFTDRLMTQRRASRHTIASYRDTIRLLLGYAQQRTGKNPADLDFTDLDAPLIGAFLAHLETGRRNSVTTRNARLTAIHSLYRYAALHVPEHAALVAGYWPSPPKAIITRPSASSPARRSAPCCQHRTPRPGPAGVTTPSCWPASRPACGYRSSPG